MTDLEAAVVGAGPHGLSAAVHLRRAGVHAQVFGEPMSFWRAMPEGMKLRSNLRATNMVEPAGPLSLEAYTADTGRQVDRPVPLAEFVDYGLWVQRSVVPDVDDRIVARIDRHRVGFQLELDDGDRVSARRVVVAAGIAPFAHIPSRFRDLPPALLSHSGRHSNLASFAGRRLAIVGGGQSAMECAALARERGADVEVLVRSPGVVYLHARAPIHYMGPVGSIVYAPTDVGPLWYSRLVAVPALFRRLPRKSQTRIAYRSIRPACAHFVRVRLNAVTVTVNTEVESAEPRGDGLQLSLSDGTKRNVDHLMFGTGYRVDVARYTFLSSEILSALRRVDGYPMLRRGLETSVPGLHIVGAPAAWSFGPILRFVSGGWYAGQAVTRAIVKSPSRRASGKPSLDSSAAPAAHRPA